MFRQGFTCPALLDQPASPHAYGAVTRSGPTFQMVRLQNASRMACSAFARHYSRNLC
jgi:hypothetical protein